MPGRVPVTVLVGDDGADRLCARVAPMLGSDGLGVLGPVSLTRLLDGMPEPGVTTLGAAPQLGWRSDGCACCTERLDVVEGLAALVRRRRPPSRLLVVARPDDDLVSLVQTVLADPDLRRAVTLDGVVVAVDGPAIATREAADLPPTAAEATALAMADLVVASDGERLTADGVDRLTAWVHRYAPVAECAVPAVVPMRLGDLVARDAWASVPTVHRRYRPPCSDGPVAVSLHADGPLDADEVQEWLDQTVAFHGPRLLRLHAVLHVVEQGGVSRPDAVRCWGVRTFAASEMVPDDDPRARLPGSRVLLVGKGLDADALAGSFPGTLR